MKFFIFIFIFIINLYSIENLLNPNNGVVITKAPTQYSNYYPYTRLNNLETNQFWLSQSTSFLNNIIFKFDNSFSQKSFNLFKLYNHGGSASVKDFALLSSKDSTLFQDVGKAGWTRAVFDSNLTININFISWIEGGVYQNTASQYSNNYPSTRMNDGDVHNAWLSQSGVYINNFDYKFDTNWDDNATQSLSMCSSFKLYGSNQSWGVKDFQVEVKYDGNTTWQRLVVPGGAVNSNFNYLSSFEIGVYQNTASQYSNNYTSTRMNDGDVHNAWLSQSGVYINNFDYKFDTNYDGIADNNITFDKFQIYGSNQSWGVKDFQVEVKYDGNTTWQRLVVPGGAVNSNFNYLSSFEIGVYQNTASQYSNNYPSTRMNDGDVHNAWLSQSGVYINNFDYKFDTNYDGIADNNITFDKFQIYGSNQSWGVKDFQVEVSYNYGTNWIAVSIDGNQTFRAQQTNGYQTYTMDSNLSNVTDVRFKTINNYGHGAYVGAKEFTVIGQNLAPSHTFRAQQTNGYQTYTMDSNLSNVTDVRFKTINNYGHGAYVGAKEFTVIGQNLAPSHTFRAQQTNGYQTYTMDSNLSNVTDVRFKTINNYGHGAYVGAKEFKFYCKSVEGKHAFTALQTASEQKFEFDYQNGSLFRFVTLNNYGNGSYLGAREIELYSDGPIASYQFEDCYYNGTLNEVKDDTGLYHGTSINGMISKYSSEKDDMFGRVAKFDGADDYVALPAFPDLVGSRTITAWFKTKDKGKSGQRIFADDEINGNGNYAISLGDSGAGRVRFYIRGLSSISLDSASVIQNNKWYFVAATFDVNTKEKTLKIYNEFGVLKDSVSAMVSGTVGVPSGTASIGGETNSGETNNRFKGSIDKVLIYNKVLTQSQIEEVLNNNLSKKQYNGIDIPRYKICPVVNYRLDDLCNSGGSSFRVAESTGSNLVGTIKPNSNSLVSRQGKVCTGAEFNGLDEYISVDDSDVLDNTQTLTTTAWIYPTELFQSNGTNARGLFSKRNNPSSQYAYGVFFWNGHNQNSTEAAIYVDIDSNNNRTHSTEKVKVNEWTHITITFDGRLPQNERTKIYINGALDSTHSESSSFIPDYSSDFHIGNLYTGTNVLKVFKGTMDEVKIYDQTLNSVDIATLYANENSGLDYSGTIRVNCTCTPNIDRNATFNAVDSLGGCFNWNRKIQTKKIDTNIDLMILSRDDNNTAVPDANITKVELLNYSDIGCSNLIETKEIWTGNEVTNDGQSGCFNLPLFTYNRASRCAKIRIYGSLDSNDINSTATDNFAIRPDKFNLTLPTIGYAGENFNIDFNATNAQDYNETLDGSFLVESNISKSVCFNAPLHVTPFSFADGVKSVDANYSDVGDINITIKEILGSEFAVVDHNDTAEADRLITPDTKSMTIKPYELNVTNVVYDVGWLYMADVGDINQKVKFSILANDKQHNLVQNFTDICYAQDVDVKTHFVVENSNSAVQIKYDDNTTHSIDDINRTITIPKASFITSKVDEEYSFNIVRDFKIPYEPIKIGLREVSVESSNIAKIENNATVSFDRDFYYGRVKTQDLSTNKQTTPHSLHVEVFKLGKYQQNSLNWYLNEDDNNTVLSFAPKVNFSYATNKTGVNILNITAIDKGTITFDMVNSWSSSDSSMIHLDIPTWLWYSQYNDYNATQDCSQHPCFEYRYIKSDAISGIQSGDFKGSSIGNDYNATKQKIGVKTFR